MNNLKIGIIVADIDEYRSLEQGLESIDFSCYGFLERKGHTFDIVTDQGKAEVISICCGIGKVNAAVAATHLVDKGCNIILNYGLSGGVNKVRKGDLVLCSNCLEHDFDLTGIGYKPCEKPGQKYVYKSDENLENLFRILIPSVKSGTAVSGDCFICDVQKRDALKENFDAMSCDMETAAIAYVCDAAKIPFLFLRRISDDAGADAYSSYHEMNTSDETLLSDYILDFIKIIIGGQSNEK